MKKDQASPRSVDEYIAGVPRDVQVILRKIRHTIKRAAPDSKETIKYQIPTYILRGHLVSFGAFKNHIGLYPVPRGTKRFQEQVAVYRSAKSTVRFPLDRPVPFDLISSLVKFRVTETAERTGAKRRKK